jgi:hypothetical protein
MPDDDTPDGTHELVALLDATHGDQFDDDDRRERLRERVAELREMGAELREADLANDDEPAFAFAPYRGED